MPLSNIGAASYEGCVAALGDILAESFSAAARDNTAWDALKSTGIVVSTDYSGMGSAEISTALLKAQCPSLHLLSVQYVRILLSCLLFVWLICILHLLRCESKERTL